MRKLTRLFALMLALTMLLGALPALAEEPANPSSDRLGRGADEGSVQC